MYYTWAVGRPTTYTEKQADEICDRLAGGESLRSICQDPMPPQSVVFQWLSKQEKFAENYTRARQFWAECEFERMMEIADTPQVGIKTKTTDKGVETIEGDMVDHRRLQVDTRKWALARMFPKKFSDSSRIAHTDPDGNVLKVEVTRVNPK